MRAEGKRTSQGMPSAVCYPQVLTMKPIKVLKTIDFCVASSDLVRNAGIGSGPAPFIDRSPAWVAEVDCSRIDPASNPNRLPDAGRSATLHHVRT